MILLNMLVLDYQKRINTPAWQMFVNNFSLFNEESGEMSFSALARAVVGHTNKSDFDHISSLYVLLHQYVRIDDEVQKDRNTKALRNGFVKVDENGAGVQAARVFLVGHLQTIERNQYMVYGGRAIKGNPSFDSQRAGIASLTVAQEKKPMWIPDIRPLLAKKWKLLKKKFNTNWGFQVAHVFPQFAKFNARRFLTHDAILDEQKGGPLVAVGDEQSDQEDDFDDCEEDMSFVSSSEDLSEDIGEMSLEERVVDDEEKRLSNEEDDGTLAEDDEADDRSSTRMYQYSSDLERQAIIAAQASLGRVFPDLSPKRLLGPSPKRRK